MHEKNVTVAFFSDKVHWWEMKGDQTLHGSYLRNEPRGRPQLRPQRPTDGPDGDGLGAHDARSPREETG